MLSFVFTVFLSLANYCLESTESKLNRFVFIGSSQLSNFAVKATQQDSVATGQVATITASDTMLHFIQNTTSTIIKHTAGRNFVWLNIFIGFILHATPF